MFLKREWPSAMGYFVRRKYIPFNFNVLRNIKNCLQVLTNTLQFLHFRTLQTFPIKKKKKKIYKNISSFLDGYKHILISRMLGVGGDHVDRQDMGVRGDSVERQQRQTEVRGGRMARQGRQNSIADFPAGFIEGTQSYTTSHTGRDNIPHRRYTIDNHTVYR